MSKRIVCFLLAIFLLADIGYSFMQHLSMSLDGDMAESILPANGIEKIARDPLGISVLKDNAFYPNPNRFFGYWGFSTYFKNFPQLLQEFVSPIDSVYMSCAISKIFIQISLTFLLAFFISGTTNIFKWEFMLSALLVTPLFQTNGYRTYMGIIDPSITYTIFYALPCMLLLLFYMPFFMEKYHERKLLSNKIVRCILVILALVVSFSGPLIPGTALIISLLFFVNQTEGHFSRIKEIPLVFKLSFIFLCLLCLYSQYINMNNSYQVNVNVSLSERYANLPSGIYYLVTQKLAFPLLLLAISLNLFLIKKYHPAGEKLLRISKWIGAFALLYILLLPLGGYKDYRPNILRYDTILPITISLLFLYGSSSYFLIRNTGKKTRVVYLSFIALFSLIFTFADEPGFGKNSCEKKSLRTLAESHDKLVLLSPDCTVMAWGKITKPEDSKLNCQLLKYWGIIKEDKLYYQK